MQTILQIKSAIAREWRETEKSSIWSQLAAWSDPVCIRLHLDQRSSYKAPASSSEVKIALTPNMEKTDATDIVHSKPKDESHDKTCNV